jgi:hypothetical protein
MMPDSAMGAGRWRSRWELVYPTADGTLQLTGSVRLHVHYYEGGTPLEHTRHTRAHTVSLVR